MSEVNGNSLHSLVVPSVEPRDCVITPDWAARAIVDHFKPTGRMLDPCRGGGAFWKHMQGADWCEAAEGRDFFGWTEPVDWIVSNPPYSTFKPWMLHSFTLAENIVYLVPLHKVFCGAKYLDAIMQYGGMPEVLVMGAGSRLGFPFGFVVGAIHFKRGYDGPTWIRRHNAEAVRTAVAGTHQPLVGRSESEDLK